MEEDRQATEQASERLERARREMEQFCEREEQARRETEQIRLEALRSLLEAEKLSEPKKHMKKQVEIAALSAGFG